MDEDRAQRVSDIKRRVRQGEYTVDPRAVADAILRRRPGLAPDGGQ
jgi:anti-sigma28 factor (negative regulator of flagellin synthesis)